VAGCGCDDFWWVRHHLGDRWEIYRPAPPILEPDDGDLDDGYYRVPIHPPFDQLFSGQSEVEWVSFVRTVGERLGIRSKDLQGVAAMDYIEDLCRRIAGWWEFRGSGDHQEQVAQLVTPVVDEPIPDAVLKVLVRGYRYGKARPAAEKAWRGRVRRLIVDLEAGQTAAA
jgi:hypothetical protein